MIRAKTWTRHDGTVYEKGDIFSAGEGDEKRLVALGAAEYVQSETGNSPKDPESEEPGKNSQDAEEENPEALVEEGNLPEIPDEDSEEEVSREELEKEYRELGGQPRDDWSLEKLLAKLEERRKDRE